MSPQTCFHVIGYTKGMAAFAAMYIAIRPALSARGRDAHLKAR
jgi:hypothetical protein